mgnify:CR=1 FL=1
MNLINYLKAKRKFNTFKKNGQDMRLTIAMASIYDYEYYHGVINAKIYKSNDDWVVTFDYTPTMLDEKLEPRIGTSKVTDEINDFGSIINKIFESTSDKFISHLHNYWKRIGGTTSVVLYVRPGNVL